MGLSDLEIVNAWDDTYNKDYYAWNDYYPFADRDLRFYLGDQWDEAEKKELYQEGRSTFVYNLIRPNINMVTGYQKKHRHSSVVIPVEQNDQPTADQLTKLLLYAFQRGNAYETISECFKGSVITGWNLLTIWKDYRTDPVNGDICFGREPYNGFICDPYFTKRDFSDCSNILRRRYISLAQAKSLLPKMDKDLDVLWKQGWDRDDKFTWLPYQQQPNGETMMAYDEYWLQGWENKKYLFNAATGSMIPYVKDEADYFLFVDPNMSVVDVQEPYVDLHIMVNNHFMKTVRNPYGLNEYPFVPFFCVFEPESSDFVLKIQSLVRTMVDPQRESNRRRSQMIDIVESQINSGWIADEDSVVNPRSLYQTSQGKVIWRKKGLQGNMLEKIPAANIPQSFFELNQIHDQDLMKVANISEELLGQADSEQDSGLKVALRQGAALVGLQDLFDNLRFGQKLLSQKCIKMMQDWGDEKIKRIINEDPTEKLKEKQTIKYDVAVQEGVLTETQQQVFFRQLITLKELGEPVPPGLLARTAPLQGKTEYLQAMEEYNKGQQEAIQKQEAAQAALLQSQTELAKTQSLSNIGLAKERIARAVANFGLEDERASQSVENRADATLKRAESIKKLEEMDDNRVMRLLDILLQIEDVNRAREESLKAEDVGLTLETTEPNQETEVADELQIST